MKYKIHIVFTLALVLTIIGAFFPWNLYFDSSTIQNSNNSSSHNLISQSVTALYIGCTKLIAGTISILFSSMAAILAIAIIPKVKKSIQVVMVSMIVINLLSVVVSVIKIN